MTALSKKCKKSKRKKKSSTLKRQAKLSPSQSPSSETPRWDTGQKVRPTARGARKETWLSLVRLFKELHSAIGLPAPQRRDQEHKAVGSSKRISWRTTWRTTIEIEKTSFLTLTTFLKLKLHTFFDPTLGSSYSISLGSSFKPRSFLISLASVLKEVRPRRMKDLMEV